ncbi:hypothetical protein [Paenibacillus sp. 481]|uniref:hypothetical protein n=1 Tax=Paenibacillus sp. 481 TaxID=2835869 RepID=UPI001E4F5064|nr:hypothetical protein [Paenibacillus sp. 481]UHA74465.1 hypothetical protein KIK04_04985 [Paenibacillus sp. 481]
MTLAIATYLMKDFLEVETEKVRLRDSANKLVPPRIHIWDLPPKTAPNQQNPPKSQESDFPFIIVRADEGVDEENESTVQVKLFFGTVSRDEEGVIDVVNLIEGIRQTVLKSRILGGKLRLKFPLKVKVYEDQPNPHWVAEMTTLWEAPRIFQEVRDHV